ncbi:MAG: hypothetical protein JXB00_19515 [Bacteroidales bacterium]|nr:hypothetical protein [Bacteroidales bacterium]
MKSSITILTLFVSFQIFGQDISFLKTTGNKNLHYLELRTENVVIYKMGHYFDKAGSGSAIFLTDTLIVTKENEFKGKLYTLIRNNAHYLLISDKGKKHETEPENDINKVNFELNNAYCLKSYFDLSNKLNKEFPLNHYTFRNGYYAWEKQPNKTINHNSFIEQTNKEIGIIYDSIFLKQMVLTKTTAYISENVGQANYSILKDSINALPIDYRPQSGYFDKSVYQMAKSNPEYFYKLLQDFPTSKKFIYFAVDHDKELVKDLKRVHGYDDLKKEFFKEYKYGKTMPYRIIGTYAIITGLLTWLIIAQP